MGTNYGSRGASWMDGNLHPGYVLNWNTTIEYQLSANNLIKLFYQGSDGVHLVESWNVNAFRTTSAQTIRRCERLPTVRPPDLDEIKLSRV